VTSSSTCKRLENHPSPRLKREVDATETFMQCAPIQTCCQDTQTTPFVVTRRDTRFRRHPTTPWGWAWPAGSLGAEPTPCLCDRRF
jgi:hypothetical protein